MSGVGTNSGSRLFIGPTVDESVDTLAEFEVLAYVEVGEVEDFGQIGDTWGEQTFTAVGDVRTRRFKTTLDGGTTTFTLGLDLDDAGQQALTAAFKNKSCDYAFKLEIPIDDCESPAEIVELYFRGKVMGKQINLGTVDNVRRRSVPIAVNSDLIGD